MLTQIKFGTSGRRAVMAEEFTFANVRRAVTGIARYLQSREPSAACRSGTMFRKKRACSQDCFARRPSHAAANLLESNSGRSVIKLVRSMRNGKTSD